MRPNGTCNRHIMCTGITQATLTCQRVPRAASTRPGPRTVSPASHPPQMRQQTGLKTRTQPEPHPPQVHMAPQIISYRVHGHGKQADRQARKSKVLHLTTDRITSCTWIRQASRDNGQERAEFHIHHRSYHIVTRCLLVLVAPKISKYRMGTTYTRRDHDTNHADDTAHAQNCVSPCCAWLSITNH